jgi:hypothetical protein
MDGQVEHGPSRTAKELVRLALRDAQLGQVISIKATIAAVRQNGPDLSETTGQLTELIVFEAVFLGLFVAFDQHE